MKTVPKPAEAANPEPRKPYLAELDEIHNDRSWELEGESYWNVFQPLIKCTAPDPDIVRRTIEDLHKHTLHYHSNYGLENLSVNCYAGVCEDVLDIAAAFASTDLRQQRLLDVLKGFKPKPANQDSQEFTMWSNVNHLAWKVREQLSAKSIYGPPRENQLGATDQEAADIHINSSAFIAKLIGSGLLPMSMTNRCAQYEMVKGLEPNTAKGNKSNVPELMRMACTVSAIEYIFHAGPQLLKVIKAPNNPGLDATEGRMKWRVWGTRLLELASTGSDNAPWYLKTNAAKAYEIMVALSPEDFADLDETPGVRRAQSDSKSPDKALANLGLDEADSEGKPLTAKRDS